MAPSGLFSNPTYGYTFFLAALFRRKGKGRERRRRNIFYKNVYRCMAFLSFKDLGTILFFLYSFPNRET